MRRAWAELRAPISTLVLLGILARLLLPLPALAAVERASFDRMLRAALCLPSGQPPVEGGSHAPDLTEGGHCPLCRLPDSALAPPPDGIALPPPGWARLPAAQPPAARGPALSPPRGPPPARAPPIAPNLG